MAEFDLGTLVVAIVFIAIVLWVIGMAIGKDPQPKGSKADKRTDSKIGRHRLGDKVLCRDCRKEYHYPKFTRCLDCNNAKLADSRRSGRRTARATRAAPQTANPSSNMPAAGRVKQRRYGATLRWRVAKSKAPPPAASKSNKDAGENGGIRKRRSSSYVPSRRYYKQFLRELHHGFIGREWWK